MKWLLVLGLIFVSQNTTANDLNSGQASNLVLSNAKQVEAAKRINSAMEKIGSRVMACVEAQNGKIEGCTCESREKCPFKEEHDAFIATFCEVMDQYPEWKKQNVFYQEGDGSIGHTLGTRNINLQYGEPCN